MEPLDQVMEFVKSLGMDYELDLNGNTSLARDLKIQGDDVEEFFYKFSQKFNVDMNDFEPEKYFKPDFLTEFINIFRGKKDSVKELTLLDLALSIKTGKLV
jgi:hypothetical protein